MIEASILAHLVLRIDNLYIGKIPGYREHSAIRPNLSLCVFPDLDSLFQSGPPNGIDAANRPLPISVRIADPLELSGHATLADRAFSVQHRGGIVAPKR